MTLPCTNYNVARLSPVSRQQLGLLFDPHNALRCVDAGR